MEIDGFRGQLITPDHAGYDTARAVWNGAVDRRPRLIAQCGGTDDVAAAVRFARDHDLEIAVRGGGHNVAGTAVCEPTASTAPSPVAPKSSPSAGRH